MHVTVFMMITFNGGLSLSLLVVLPAQFSPNLTLLYNRCVDLEG